MRATDSIPKRWGWVITEKGRLDLHTNETCRCDPHLVGLLIECATCGTVYGSLRDDRDWSAGAGAGKR